MCNSEVSNKSVDNPFRRCRKAVPQPRIQYDAITVTIIVCDGRWEFPCETDSDVIYPGFFKKESLISSRHLFSVQMHHTHAWTSLFSVQLHAHAWIYYSASPVWYRWAILEMMNWCVRYYYRCNWVEGLDLNFWRWPGQSSRISAEQVGDVSKRTY